MRVGADQARRLEAVLQVADELLRVFVQGDLADAGIAGGHQQGAQRALGDREADVHARAVLAEGGGRHAQDGGCGFVEASAGIEAGVIHGVGDAGALLQALARAVGAQGSGIGLGGDARGRLEDAMEMKPAHAGLLGQLGQVWRLLGLQRAAGALDGGGVLFAQRGGGVVHKGLLTVRGLCA
ncbi:hypothetical protein D9M68_602260 [compost metagenome]